MFLTGLWLVLSLDVRQSKDLVTDVDKRCQEIVEETVLESLPDHAILGEETTAAGSDASRDALEENLSKEWLWCVELCAHGQAASPEKNILLLIKVSLFVLFTFYL